MPSLGMAFCTQCGRSVPEAGSVCPDCLKQQHPPSTIAGQEAHWLFDDAPKPHTSGKATASMILGFFFFFLPCAFLAIVLGHMSLGDIKKSAGKLAGHGRAKAGLVLGYTGIVLLPVFLIGVAIVIPALMRARISANEASAVAFLRRLNTAEFRYSQAKPDHGFTCDFRDLEEFGVPEGRIPGMTLSVQKDGYTFMLEGCKGRTWNETRPTTSYAIAAAPISVNTSGTRLFCSDQTAVVKFGEVRKSIEQCLEEGTPLE
jgi:type IV pilus assembly protein PilA